MGYFKILELETTLYWRSKSNQNKQGFTKVLIHVQGINKGSNFSFIDSF